MDGGAQGNDAPPEEDIEKGQPPFSTPFLTQGDNEMSPAAKPLPNSFGFTSKRGPGRVLYFWQVVQLLSTVRETGQWPHNVKLPMQRYYKREYSEYFSNGKRAETKRAANKRKADELRAQNRPSRRKHVQSSRSTPIDLESKRRERA